MNLKTISYAKIWGETKLQLPEYPRSVLKVKSVERKRERRVKVSVNKKEGKTGSLWPPAASNSTKLTFFPLSILVGVVVIIVIVVVTRGKQSELSWSLTKKKVW